MVTRGEVLADGLMRYGLERKHDVDLVAWALVDALGDDRRALLLALDELDDPSIYEQMTGEPL